MPDDVFRWVIAVGVFLAAIASVVQAVIFVGVYRAGKEAQKTGKEAQAKLAPLVDNFEAFLSSFNKFLTTSGAMLAENRPRIAEITAETLVAAKTARQQAERIGGLIDDASGRVKARMAQIDQTVDHTVEQVESATDAVKNAVMKPVKEVNGIVAGVKAALNTYAQGGNRNSPEHATQDEEMFI
jgi:ABC-type transporter Mla subunit MlaD